MKQGALALCLLLCLLLLQGSERRELPARVQYTPSATVEAPAADPVAEAHNQAVLEALEALAAFETSRPVDRDFLDWACARESPDFARRLAAELPGLDTETEPFYALFGETLHVLWDRYTGALDSDPTIRGTGSGNTPTLAFAGDVNLADDWENMLVYYGQGQGLEGVFAPSLLERMRAADILLVNNEFCLSHRGSAMPGKTYTFRARPENAELLEQMGVDIVSLANNHVYDYGGDAFLDTLDTLAGADLPYVGAGRSLEEAMEARYFHAGGMKIAYVAASRAENYVVTPGATPDSPGVLWCYEDGDLLEAVARARRNADWVVVYLHWGTEYEPLPNEAERELGYRLIDAGADFVVGAHPHVLQGFEFYRDRPIAYSLGNFWFNVGWMNTALLEIDLLGPGEYTLRVLPCYQGGGYTSLLEEDAARLGALRLLEEISFGAAIDQDGVVLPCK